MFDILIMVIDSWVYAHIKTQAFRHLLGVWEHMHYGWVMEWGRLFDHLYFFFHYIFHEINLFLQVLSEYTF